MAANENIWQILQKLSDKFPGNLKEVEQKIFDYYRVELKYNPQNMEIVAEQFPKERADRIKLLAMVVYADIQGASGEAAIYRSSSISKYVFRLVGGMDCVQLVEVFKIALEGKDNAALKAINKVLEIKLDDNQTQIYHKMEHMFKTMLTFDDHSRSAIAELFVSLLSLNCSESQPIDEGLSIKPLDTPKAVITEIMEKIQGKIDSFSELRDVLIALKADLARIDHDAKGQPVLHKLFQAYSQSLANDSSFCEDLEELFTRYDTCANDIEKAAFSFNTFELTLFAVKAKKVMEIFNKDAIKKELDEIKTFISGNSKILENSAADETRELNLAIQKSSSALDSVRATSTIQNVEQNLKELIDNLFKIVAIASWGIKQSLNKEIYEKIQAKANALLTVVNAIYLPISEEVWKQRETSKSLVPSCGGR